MTNSDGQASPEGPPLAPEPTAEPVGPSLAARPRPRPLDAGVTAQMSRMPRRDTKPELQIRRLLHARGLRYRVDDKRLPGRPDIVFAGARLAVFIDGCFWHACPEHGVLPKNNREWWRSKLSATVERDHRKDENLWTLGWSVVHIWEHEQPIAAAERIASAVASKTKRRAP